MTVTLLGSLLVAPNTASAAPEARVGPASVELGRAAPFSILAGTGLTNTGASTTLAGDLGLSPGGTITDLPEGAVAGTVHDKDAVAAAAQTDRLTAYNDAAGREVDETFDGDQKGEVFGPGVYRTETAFSNTGVVALDAGGDPNAVFIFKFGGAFTPGAKSSVSLRNGAQSGKVFWVIDSAIVMGADTSYVGTFLVSGDVTLSNRSNLSGRVLTNGSVTLANAAINRPIVDTIYPQVTLNGAPEYRSSDTTPVIAGTTDESFGVVKVIASGLTTVTQAREDGTWAVTMPKLKIGNHRLAARVTDGAGNTGTTNMLLQITGAPTASSVYRADAAIRLPFKPWIGRGVVGKAKNQTVRAKTTTGKTSRIVVRLRNAGRSPDRFRIRANPGNSAFRVDYIVGSKNANWAVTGGSYTTRMLKPGEAVWVAILVTPVRGTRRGAKKTFTLRANSRHAPGRHDSVAATVAVG